ncbi:MAG: SH3 domain-containing protein [Chloroflexota bacterium]
MKKVTLWGLVIVFGLLFYLAFTLLFTVFFREFSRRGYFDTASSPPPTMTPGPVVTAQVVAVITPEALPPSPTFTPLPSPTPPATSTATPLPPTATPLPSTATPLPLPQVASAVTVNVRSGPGTNYPVIGSLPPGVSVAVVGRNEGSTWWQIQGPDGSTGWVAGAVVQASNVGAGIPVAAAPPPPQPPTPTPVPATPQPKYQYEPTGWYGDTNYGLTRFLGTITDTNGNPVDGVFVEARCGDFRVISNPSGPVGWGPFNESHTWPPGFYDITLDTKPIACHWILSVVETPDKETVAARLSEEVEVETTHDQSIIVANWRKNW